jgi:predicted amidohydrolase
LLRARAIENQCYITGVNRIGTDGFGSNHIGGSKTIGPWGEDISTAENSTEGWAVSKLESIHLHAVRKRYPFLDDADSFMIK